MPDLGFTIAASIIFATGVTSGAAVTGIITAVNLAFATAPCPRTVDATLYIAKQDSLR